MIPLKMMYHMSIFFDFFGWDNSISAQNPNCSGFFFYWEDSPVNSHEVIAPNCTVGSSARIRDVCEFCVACCNDYCHLEISKRPEGTGEKTTS